MVNLIFAPDNDTLTTRGIVKTLYDTACGTGGMLSVSEEYLRELNPDARLEVFGQDYNDQAYAICGSDMMIKGQSLDNIRFGDCFTEDHMAGKTFDYMLANPPFGVEWKPEENAIRKEYEEQGFGGRFGAGLPRINDGSFLFLQQMISKMKPPKEGGTRLGIVFNGSPLFTGAAGSGESSIRQWIIENDWLEAIVALPDQLFYNTGISTYIWIVTNRKEKSRRGKIQIVDGTGLFREDEEEPRQQAQRDRGRQQRETRPDRRDHPPLRQVQTGGTRPDLRQQRLRIPAHHRGAAPEAQLRRHRGSASPGSGRPVPSPAWPQARSERTPGGPQRRSPKERRPRRLS